MTGTDVLSRFVSELTTVPENDRAYPLCSSIAVIVELALKRLQLAEEVPSSG